jgi:CubicO group peptidase (beta-lactamase class C family)
VLSIALAVAALAAGCSGPEGEQAGSVEARIESAVARQLDIAASFDSVRAIVVSQQGRIVFAHYYDSDPGDYYAVQSVTKSVMSALIGIAVDEGLLTLDSRLDQLLPRYADRMSRAEAAVSVRQLLTMTAGFVPEGDDDRLFVESRDVVGRILDLGVRRQGSFSYSNAGAHLLSAILVEATGQSVLEYARVKLFDPLGIDTRPALEPRADPRNVDEFEAADFAWMVDPQGIELGWAFLKLRAADLVAFGECFLDEGRHDGQQVVPAEWVEDATSHQVSAPSGVLEGYGYEWWVGELDGAPAYLAWGFGGQVVAVVPSREVVVAVQTELALDEPASQLTRGVSVGPMLTLVDTAILRNVPAT